MYVALQFLCLGLTIGAPAILLAARFFWPRRVPWWLVVGVTAVLSTLLDAATDHLGPRADLERDDACFAAHEQRPLETECEFWTYDVWVLPIHAKWIPGLLILMAWLPFYGLAVRARAKRER